MTPTMVEFLARAAAVYALVVWAGGIFHLTFAAIPDASRLDTGLRLRVMAGMMRRYNPFAWTALPVLLAATSYLALFKTGLTLVPIITLLAVAASIHSFIYGPRKVRGDGAARRKALTLAWAETLMVFGLPPLVAALL
jgi:uncharacterized membrane protein